MLVFAVIGGLCIFFAYRLFFKSNAEQLYSTQKMERRDITHIIKATGFLEVEDTMKIGSIVPGIIHKMHVDENEQVKRGQLLAEIDDGKNDTEVKETKAVWDGAEADLVYLEAFFQRQKALYEDDQISKDTFQDATRQLEVAQAEVRLKNASYDKAKLEFDNKKIVAPDDGIVISKIARKGETVTLASPPTLIYLLAKDIKKMNAKLEIDESSVGALKKGATAMMTFDPYPHKIEKAQPVL